MNHVGMFVVSARESRPPNRISYWKMCVSSCCDEVLELLVGEVDREDHPVARRLGERADPLGDEVQDDVVLLELGVRDVVDERDRLRDLVVQPARELVVGRLGHRDDLLRARPRRGRSGRSEVRRLVDLPVELVVDDLVLPLRGRRTPRRGGGPRTRPRARRAARRLVEHIAVGLPFPHDEEAEQLVLQREEVLEEPHHLVGGTLGLLLLVVEVLLEELRPRPAVDGEDRSRRT